MRAVQYNKYGDYSVLEINENAPTPSLKQDQVLVENYAASINPFYIKLRLGYMQKMIPLNFPVTIGGDFSGKIIEVSKGISDFKNGDEIYGSAQVVAGASGSMAEYLAASLKNISLKPKNISFIEAAALPLVGASAIQALIDHINLQPGQKILIHGGAGGIGHIAIQLAKSIGAFVVTTVNGSCFEFVKSLGADQILDYKTQKFAEILQDFDSVFDTAGGEVTDNSYKVLKKGGILVSMAGQPDQELAEKYGVTAIGQNTKTNTVNLDRLRKLVEANSIKVHIDKIFPLQDAREAFKYKEENHPQGKVVVNIR